MIIVESHKKKLETLQKQYPGAIIHDVTSHAADDFVKFSPFYPHKGIPVPFTPNETGACVEGIWQGLKVFETVGCDASMLRNDTMKNIKRTARKFGKPKGHQKGLFGKELLDYSDARKLIYLPTYKWVLDNKLQHLVKVLKEESENKTVILLDYNTNCNAEDLSTPLSHAGLIKAYIDGEYPSIL